VTIASGAGGKNFLNLSLDGLIAAGGSTSTDIANLQPGGHDPSQRGFTVQNLEAVFDGAVDPYFKGQANVVLQIAPDGSTNVELEEAYVTTTSLPAGLQLKAGQFFTDFGRLNPTHPHAWDFVDVPLAKRPLPRRRRPALDRHPRVVAGADAVLLRALPRGAEQPG
jgi:hypothetical protein